MNPQIPDSIDRPAPYWDQSGNIWGCSRNPSVHPQAKSHTSHRVGWVCEKLLFSSRAQHLPPRVTLPAQQRAAAGRGWNHRRVQPCQAPGEKGSKEPGRGGRSQQEDGVSRRTCHLMALPVGSHLWGRPVFRTGLPTTQHSLASRAHPHMASLEGFGGY